MEVKYNTTLLELLNAYKVDNEYRQDDELTRIINTQLKELQEGTSTNINIGVSTFVNSMIINIMCKKHNNESVKNNNRLFIQVNARQTGDIEVAFVEDKYTSIPKDLLNELSTIQDVIDLNIRVDELDVINERVVKAELEDFAEDYIPDKSVLYLISLINNVVREITLLTAVDVGSGSNTLVATRLFVLNVVKSILEINSKADKERLVNSTIDLLNNILVLGNNSRTKLGFRF